MSSTDFTRTPACRAAEAALARIVGGEADAREREEFAAHLAACPRCNHALPGVLALAGEVRTALHSAAACFPEAPPLQLPPRTADGRAARAVLRVLTDFVLLLVLGLGLFLLIALAFVSYRSASRAHDSIRVFRAVQDIAVLTHLYEHVRAREPDLSPEARAARVKLEAARLLGGETLTDPWGTPYVLAPDGVRSAGPNRLDEAGAGDDVTSRSRAPSIGTPPRRPAGRAR